MRAYSLDHITPSDLESYGLVLQMQHTQYIKQNRSSVQRLYNFIHFVKERDSGITRVPEFD